MRTSVTWRRGLGGIILLLGAVLIAVGTWQQRAPVSMLGLACWVAIVVALLSRLIQRVEVATRRSARNYADIERLNLRIAKTQASKTEASLRKTYKLARRDSERVAKTQTSKTEASLRKTYMVARQDSERVAKTQTSKTEASLQKTYRLTRQDFERDRRELARFAASLDVVGSELSSIRSSVVTVRQEASLELLTFQRNFGDFVTSFREWMTASASANAVRSKELREISRMVKETRQRAETDRAKVEDVSEAAPPKS
jgi:hypothetical protein